MTPNQIDHIARAAVQKFTTGNCIDDLVQSEMYDAGYIWLGFLDGSDRSIRSVSRSLKRDAAAGRIYEAPDL
jgi:hypothetical protein